MLDAFHERAALVVRVLPATADLLMRVFDLTRWTHGVDPLAMSLVDDMGLDEIPLLMNARK